MPAEPYQDTGVSVVRSQAAIERLLADAGQRVQHAMETAYRIGFISGYKLRLREESKPQPEGET